MRHITTLTLSLLILIMGSAILPISTTAQQGCGDSVTVTEGDTLFEIARRCGTTVSALLEANHEITDPRALEVGQTIDMPTAGFTQSIVAIYPAEAAPGTQVTIIGNRFRINTDVTITLGPEGQIPVITRDAQTTEQGSVIQQVTIPQVTVENPRWRATIAEQNTANSASSSLLWMSNDSTTTPPDDANVYTQTDIYLIDLNANTSICMEPARPYTINIDPTVAPLTAGLQAMFNSDQATYPGSNLHNEFYESDLKVSGINIENGLATIDLIGQLITIGNCSARYMTQQIEQTALQFSTIDRVQVNLNGQPLESRLSRRGDA